MHGPRYSTPNSHWRRISAVHREGLREAEEIDDSSAGVVCLHYDMSIPE